VTLDADACTEVVADALDLDQVAGRISDGVE